MITHKTTSSRTRPSTSWNKALHRDDESFCSTTEPNKRISVLAPAVALRHERFLEDARSELEADVTGRHTVKKQVPRAQSAEYGKNSSQKYGLSKRRSSAVVCLAVRAEARVYNIDLRERKPKMRISLSKALRTARC